MATSDTAESCATFVLAIFQSLQLPLVDLRSWPTRPEDVPWQEKIVAYLRSSSNPATQAHAERVAQDIGCARLRPEEVAAAASATSLPASFAHVQQAASVIIAAL